MLTVLAAIADAGAWADRNAYVVAWVALAAGVTVLVGRALPRPEPERPDAETAPDAEADFDEHPDAAELEALFADVLTEPQPPPDPTDPRPHLP